MTIDGRRLARAALLAGAVAGWVAAVGALGALAGCGGGGTDRTKAQVRLVNASAGYEQLDLREDQEIRQAAVPYGGSAAYAAVDPGPDELTVHAAGSPTALLTSRPALGRDKFYTLLAYGNAGALQQHLLEDELGRPDAGRTTLRVINAAPDAGALDVYVTTPTEALQASVPLQAGAAYGAVGGWLTVPSGSWRLRVAAAGSKTDLRLDLPALVLASRDVVTLVLTPTRGGVLVNALALVQQAGITRADGAQARVRVVAGVADAGAVSAALAGTTLLNAVSAPAVGPYVLVNAGTERPTLAVDGVALGAPDTTLAVGGDYTLLVHGPRAAPRADWLVDDNRLPTVAGRARVRLVNGVADVAAPLAMTVDFLPLADGVTVGAGSAYAGTDASTTARIAVTAQGLAAPLFLGIDQRFDAGAVYSVFVLGAQGATTGILRKDR